MRQCLRPPPLRSGLNLQDQLADMADLWQSRGEEMLMAKTWADGHGQHLVHVLQDFFQKACGVCMVDDNSSSLAQRLDVNEVGSGLFPSKTRHSVLAEVTGTA